MPEVKRYGVASETQADIPTVRIDPSAGTQGYKMLSQLGQVGQEAADQLDRLYARDAVNKARTELDTFKNQDLLSRDWYNVQTIPQDYQKKRAEVADKMGANLSGRARQLFDSSLSDYDVGTNQQLTAHITSQLKRGRDETLKTSISQISSEAVAASDDRLAELEAQFKADNGALLSGLDEMTKATKGQEGWSKVLVSKISTVGDASPAAGLKMLSSDYYKKGLLPEDAAALTNKYVKAADTEAANQWAASSVAAGIEMDAAIKAAEKTQGAFTPEKRDIFVKQYEAARLMKQQLEIKTAKGGYDQLLTAYRNGDVATVAQAKAPSGSTPQQVLDFEALQTSLLAGYKATAKGDVDWDYLGALEQQMLDNPTSAATADVDWKRLGTQASHVAELRFKIMQNGSLGSEEKDIIDQKGVADAMLKGSPYFYEQGKKDVLGRPIAVQVSGRGEDLMRTQLLIEDSLRAYNRDTPKGKRSMRDVERIISEAILGAAKGKNKAPDALSVYSNESVLKNGKPVAAMSMPGALKDQPGDWSYDPKSKTYFRQQGNVIDFYNDKGVLLRSAKAQ